MLNRSNAIDKVIYNADVTGLASKTVTVVDGNPGFLKRIIDAGQADKDVKCIVVTTPTPPAISTPTAADLAADPTLQRKYFIGEGGNDKTFSAVFYTALPTNLKKNASTTSPGDGQVFTSATKNLYYKSGTSLPFTSSNFFDTLDDVNRDLQMTRSSLGTTDTNLATINSRYVDKTKTIRLTADFANSALSSGYKAYGDRPIGIYDNGSVAYGTDKPQNASNHIPFKVIQ
jgi:hypothetical protein